MSVEVRLRGPFLKGIAPAVMRDTISAAITDLTAEGERKVKLQLYRGHGVRTGHYRRSVHGEVSASSFGASLPVGTIHDSGVVYGPWLEGVSSRNDQTRFKGYAMFRNAKQELERMKGAVLQQRVNQALTRLR